MSKTMIVRSVVLLGQLVAFSAKFGSNLI